MRIFALFYVLRSGGVITLIALFAILLSLSKANIHDAFEIGFPMLIISITMPVVMQPWKDDNKNTKNVKFLVQTSWYCTLVLFYTILIFLSSAHLISLIFLITGLIFAVGFSSGFEAEKYSETTWKYITIFLCCSLSLWTFLGTITNASIINFFDPIFNCYALPNTNHFTGFILGIPIIGIIGYIVYYIFKRIVKIIHTFLFDFSNLVYILKNYTSQFKWNSNICDINDVFIVAIFHTMAFVLGRYLSSNKEFVVFLTNFQIDTITVNNNVFKWSIYISFIICLSIIIGQKIIKYKLKNNYSTKHFIKLFCPMVVFMIILTTVWPLSNIKITDKTGVYAITFASSDYTPDITCPICHNEYQFQGTTNRFYLSYDTTKVYCTYCDASWFITPEDSIKKAKQIGKERRIAEEKKCYRLNAIKQYSNWTSFNGDWKKCRKQFLKPYEEDNNYVKGFTTRKTTMPEFIGDTLWIYSSFYYNYPENKQKFADSIKYIINDCKLSKVIMASYKNGNYVVIYDQDKTK